MLKYTREKGLLALTLSTWRKAVAFALFSFLCLTHRHLPIMSLEGRWCPSVPEPVLLRGGGLALSASGRFVEVLLHFLQEAPSFGPWPRLPLPNGRGVSKTWM